MYKSQSIKEIASALLAFQKEVGNVAKDATNPFFKSKYASLENVINTVKPVLAKHGLSYSQMPEGEGLNTLLMHTSGEYLEAWAQLKLKDETPQGQGSAITYMRRYALSSILGIATEDDDDGNAATQAKPLEKPKAIVKPVTPPKSVVVEQKKAEIKKLVNDKALNPVVTVGEFKTYIKENTGLDFEEANYDAIIERLKTL